MAFPSAPANGAIATFGGASYQYITATNTWKRTGFGLLATTITKTRFVATDQQTAFVSSVPFATDGVDVYLNGIKLIKTSDYVETNSTTITMTAPCAASDDVELVVVTGV